MCKWLLISVLRLVLQTAADVGGKPESHILDMFGNMSRSPTEHESLQHAFDALYQHCNDTFDFDALAKAREVFRSGVQQYHGTDAYAGYRYYPDRPHCDLGVAQAPRFVNSIRPFPGGVAKKAFGSEFARSVLELSQHARGPAAAGLLPLTTLESENLKLGMSMVQTVIAALVHTIPPLIPPPAWNNQPLPCAPMITGHNCFGAVLYPITMADFVLADVTDSMLDGVIAGFPNTYATKVGKTSDEMYKACFASYMSMHCSSIFPRCSTPQSREETVPTGGRVPMCLHMCIIPLVMCPGFWVDDVIGTCSMVSVPPLCTQAFFANLWRLPPQYVDFDEAHPFPRDCPPVSATVQGEGGDLELYDIPQNQGSPILKVVDAVGGSAMQTPRD